MNKRTMSLIAFGLVLMAGAVLAAGAADLPKAPYVKQYTEAVQSAQAKNQYVLIDFYTDWCTWCKKFDTEVFTDPRVISFFTNDMVFMRTEAEKEDTALARKYSISAFPTMVMVDAQGTEIDRVVGYYPADDFLKMVNDYRNGIGTLDDLLDSSKTTTDRAMFYTIAEKYQYRGKPAEAEAWYGKVVSAGSPTDSLSGASRMALAQMSVSNKELDKAATMYESIRTDFKGTPTEGEAALSLGLMYRSAMMWDKALATFDAMRTEFKGQNWEAEAAWFTCGLYLRKGDTATAVEHYRKMAEEFQNFSDPSYAKKANDQVANLTKPKTEAMR